jgi:enoyl reductase
MMRHMAIVGGAALLVLAGTLGPAGAADGPPGGDTSTYNNGNRRGIAIKGLRLSGDVGSADTSTWQGPACWRAPWLSGPAMAARVEGVHRRSGGGRETSSLPGDISKHRDEDGYWWKPTSNGTAGGVSCESGMEPPVVWVPEGAPPPPGAITPAILAQIARAYLDLPAPQVSLNPRPPRRSYVGVGTWVWAEPVQQQRQVTAALPALNMSATVTASRSDLAIDPGTPDTSRYEVHACDGLGERYPANASRGDAERTPPCGVTYLRASSDQPNKEYTLTAQLTWNVNWQGSDGSGGGMAPATLGDSVQIPVGEVQTTVRD